MIKKVTAAFDAEVFSCFPRGSVPASLPSLLATTGDAAEDRHIRRLIAPTICPERSIVVGVVT